MIILAKVSKETKEIDSFLMVSRLEDANANIGEEFYFIVSEFFGNPSDFVLENNKVVRRENQD